MKRILILCEVLAAAAVAGALLLALPGCGPGKHVDYRIAVVPKGLTHEFWQSIHRGADRAAADLKAEDGLDVEILWDGPSKESDEQEQITIIDQKSSQGIHGLVLAPQHSKALVPSVERCVKSNIPVVIIDSGLDPAALKKKPDLIVKYVATDNYDGGWLAAEELVNLLEKEGKKDPRLVLFRYQVGSESTEQREKGFLDRVKAEAESRKGEPGPVVINDSVYAGATVDTAQKNAVSLLNLVKDKADGIFAVNESATNGLLNEMRSRELNGKIVLMGFDSSAPLRQAVEKGDVVGLIVQDPYRMGYLGVWTLVQHLRGYDVNRDHEPLGTGEFYLTKGNINDDEMKGKFAAEFQAKRKIDRPTFPKK